MRRRQADEPRSGCPIGLALDLIGDPWTLLVVRDLMFKGAKTFRDFVDAGEGIATNVLTDRLARLVASGIVAKRRDATDARRFRYRLTAKGMDLAPVLVELVLWSSRYLPTDAPPEVVQAMRADREGFLAQLRQEWKRSVGRRADDAPRRRSTVR
ncbi:MAG: winged helix-turn-helix transcriptional regulator [Lautropia sp.]